MDSAPTKEQCLFEHARLSSYLMKDFETKLKKHHSENHKFMIQASVHGACRDLVLDKQLVIYLILGSNPRRESWGNLREKYDIDAIKYVLRKEVVSKGQAVLKDKLFKVYFGDPTGNGDFKMKIDFFDKKSSDDAKSDSGDKEDKPWVKVVKTAPKPKVQSKPRPAIPQPPRKVVPASTTETEVAALKEQIASLTQIVKELSQKN